MSAIKGVTQLPLSISPVSFQKSAVPDDAVEALASSLGKKEADPDDGKPVVDKIKVQRAV